MMMKKMEIETLGMTEGKIIGGLHYSFTMLNESLVLLAKL